MLRAIAKRRNWKRSNTRVNIVNEWAEVFLFGNKIAQINLNTGEIYANHCGWTTRTTLSRFRALGIRVQRRNNSWHAERADILTKPYVWSMLMKRSGIISLYLHFNKDGYLVEEVGFWPEMLTEQQIREAERQQRIMEEKSSSKAKLKHLHRQWHRDHTMWSNPDFF